MTWRAIVPLKAQEKRKSRLAGRLTSSQRSQLVLKMFGHVLSILQGHPAIESVSVLADERPTGWSGEWIVDEGRGLNTELESARAEMRFQALLIVHADLPLLARADIDALIDGAIECEIAIGSDRHSGGTNALALSTGSDIRFRFGADSFRLHREQAPASAVISRQGLALDIDSPDDLSLAFQLGFTCPPIRPSGSGPSANLADQEAGHVVRHSMPRS
jgi:2-phospho-L-lactate guanylyltransferase